MVKESDVYATLKERVDADGSQVVEHLQKLVEFSAYYEIFLWPERTPVVALSERFARLRRLEVTVAYPFRIRCANPRSGFRERGRAKWWHGKTNKG
jgi:hypothetical protein